MGVVLKFERKPPPEPWPRPEQVRNTRISMSMLKEAFMLKPVKDMPQALAIDPPGKLDNDISTMLTEIGLLPPPRKG